MSRTRHMGKRMNQRGIDHNLIANTLQFGKTAPGKEGASRCYLNRKGIDLAVGRHRRFVSQLLRARDKGGAVVVVTPEGYKITTYQLNSYRRPRRKR